jgi:hypothetical protein
VALIPNAVGTFYTVVYQLGDGTVKTEYWIVTSTSPTTIAAIRTILGSGKSAMPPASQQYVKALVATKANDAVVVHKSGSETIAGVKQFSAPPNVPTPVQPTDAVNKAYVDSAIGGTGGGPFVSRAGDTITGPLQLCREKARFAGAFMTELSTPRLRLQSVRRLPCMIAGESNGSGCHSSVLCSQILVLGFSA